MENKSQPVNKRIHLIQKTPLSQGKRGETPSRCLSPEEELDRKEKKQDWQAIRVIPKGTRR